MITKSAGMGDRGPMVCRTVGRQSAAQNSLPRLIVYIMAYVVYGAITAIFIVICMLCVRYIITYVAI